MKKAALFVLCFLALAVPPAVAQVSYTAITGSLVLDGGGNPLQKGTITFTPGDNNGNPMSSTGVFYRSITCTVGQGIIGLQTTGLVCKVADALAANPQLCYKVTLYDSVRSVQIPTPGQVCAQPHGSTWSYDSYTPNMSSATLVQTGPPGPAGADGIGSDPSCHADGSGHLSCLSVSATTGKFTSNASGASLPVNYGLTPGYGDSVMAGHGDPTGGMPHWLTGLTGFSAPNQGVGGQPSGPIAARLGAYPNLTITVAGNSIPGGASCTTTMTWDQVGYEASFNVNSVVPDTSQLPPPYNNGNGANLGGLWGVVNGVDVQTTYGFWDTSLVPPAWNNDGNYYITAWQNVNGVLQCPASATSIPAHSTWAPKFTFPGSLLQVEMGFNNITSGTTQVEADIAATMTSRGYGTPSFRSILTPVWYSAAFQPGGISYNNVAAVNTWTAATYPLAWPVVNGQNLLQYLGSLYNPSDLYDAYDHTFNPLLVPPSMRLFTPNAGTLTAAITDTTSCSPSLSGGTANVEYITVDSESIRINPSCIRAYGGTLAATHLSGASYGAKDAVHMVATANQAWAAFNDIWILQNGLLGNFTTAGDVGNMMAHPNGALYALLTNRNTFLEDQEIGPRAPATSTTNQMSNNFIIAGQYMDSGGHPHDIGVYFNAFVGPGSTPSQATLQGLPYGVPAGTPVNVALSVPFGLLNSTTSTALTNQPSYPFSYTGTCWNGSIGTATEKVTPTPFSAGGKFGLNFAGASGCANSFQLQSNGKEVATLPFAVPPWLEYVGAGSEGAGDCNGNLNGNHHYTTFNVGVGHTCTVNTIQGLTVHATGACTINGTITATPLATTQFAGPFGTGGGGGGGTGAGTAANSNTLYPSGSTGNFVSGGTAGASSGGAGGNGNQPATSLWKTILVGGINDGAFWFGGPGGAGNGGAAGGQGGGSVILICGSITGTGTINTSGANGANSAGNNAGGGGGGAGGPIILSSQAAETFTLTLTQTGGTGGTCGSFTGCGVGGNGVAGQNATFSGW